MGMGRFKMLRAVKKMAPFESTFKLNGRVVTCSER